MRRVREDTQEVSNYCNTEIVLSVVGGKWKLLILKYLLLGTRRFSELKSSIPAVTHRMLTRQLRELENDALIKRTVYPEVPARVEYCLTEVGRTLEPLIDQFHDWGGWYRKCLDGQELDSSHPSNDQPP